MLQINPNHSDRLVNSIQRDYYQSAETHRLQKECGVQKNRSRKIVTVTLSLIAFATAVSLISQFPI